MVGDPEHGGDAGDDVRDEIDDDDVRDEIDDDDVRDAVETPLEPSGDGDIIANARRRYGTGGALLAAGMLGLDNLLREKVKPDSVQVQESPTEPVDVDSDGIQVAIDETLSVHAPALERMPLLNVAKKRRRG